jgi:hypothetical protein
MWLAVLLTIAILGVPFAFLAALFLESYIPIIVTSLGALGFTCGFQDRFRQLGPNSQMRPLGVVGFSIVLLWAPISLVSAVLCEIAHVWGK